MILRKSLVIAGVLLMSFWLTTSISAFYNPAQGRWLSRDPIGETGGINLYAFARNNPVNWFDPWGFSPEDVTKILDAFNTYISENTQAGRRHPDPHWNNMMRSLHGLTSGLNITIGPVTIGPLGSPYSSCGEQWIELKLQFLRMMQDDLFDDMWSPETCEREDKTHTWGILQSNNPEDPVLILDPWRNKTTRVYVPQPNVPLCYQGIIPEQPYIIPIK